MVTVGRQAAGAAAALFQHLLDISVLICARTTRQVARLAENSDARYEYRASWRPNRVCRYMSEEAILRPVRERRGRHAIAHVQMLEAAMPCGMTALGMIGRYGRLRTERDEDNGGRKA